MSVVGPRTKVRVTREHRGALLPTLAALAVLPGCGHVRGNHYQVAVDPAFSAADVEAIADAAASWEVAVGELELPLVIASCGGVAAGVICVHAVSADEVSARSGTSLAAGHTDWSDEGGETWMRVPTSQWFQREVAHEMGHAMGLEHHGPGTLMYFSANDEPPAPTVDDVLQWHEVRAL